MPSRVDHGLGEAPQMSGITIRFRYRKVTDSRSKLLVLINFKWAGRFHHRRINSNTSPSNLREQGRQTRIQPGRWPTMAQCTHPSGASSIAGTSLVAGGSPSLGETQSVQAADAWDTDSMDQHQAWEGTSATPSSMTPTRTGPLWVNEGSWGAASSPKSSPRHVSAERGPNRERTGARCLLPKLEVGACDERVGDGARRRR